MTLDACEWLEGKHTIFGKVEGNTIYNLMKISEVETDAKTSRPICDPIPKILRIEVTINPFSDIIPRNLSIRDKYEGYEEVKSEAKVEPKKKTQIQQSVKSEVSVIKNKNLLSFDED